MIKVMVSLDLLQAEAKRDLTNAILDEMGNYLDNSQLMELNQSLNSNLSTIEVYKHNATTTDYEERNRELVGGFLRAKKLKGLSKKSLNAYGSELNFFLDWSCKLVLDYEPQDIREYLLFRQELNNCSNVSLNNYRRYLSAFYKWLEIEEYPNIRSLAEDVLHIQRLIEANMFSGEYDYIYLEKLCELENIQSDMHKYIYYMDNQGYRIQKNINGDIKYFGTYNSREDAVMVRNLLIDNDWDKEVLEIVDEMF